MRLSGVLVRTCTLCCLLAQSAGTERSSVRLGGARPWCLPAGQTPDMCQGILATAKAVWLEDKQTKRFPTRGLNPWPCVQAGHLQPVVHAFSTYPAICKADALLLRRDLGALEPAESTPKQLL